MNETPSELAWAWRILLRVTAVQCIVQGGQYALVPQRPLRAQQYATLRPIGSTGWVVIGLLLVTLAIATLLVSEPGLSCPRWLDRAAPFGLLAAVLAFQFVSALFAHGQVAATLILPVGVCLIEVRVAGVNRQRRRAERRASGCG